MRCECLAVNQEHPSLGSACDLMSDGWIATPMQQLLSPDFANRTAYVANWRGIVCLCGGNSSCLKTFAVLGASLNATLEEK